MSVYVHFPLCFLNFDKDLTKTSDYIISYGICNYAIRLRDEQIEYSEDVISDFITENKLNYLDIRSSFNCYLILACKNMDVIPGYEVIKRYEKINSYHNRFINVYGNDCFVRVHKNILFDVKDKKFNPDLFRVYSAVLSYMGKKKYVRIVYSNIKLRAQGFKSNKIKVKPVLNELTIKQIRNLIKKLKDKNLMTVYTFKNRYIYYSTKLSEEELTMIINNKHYKSKNIVRDVIPAQKKQTKQTKILELAIPFNNGLWLGYAIGKIEQIKGQLKGNLRAT